MRLLGAGNWRASSVVALAVVMAVPVAVAVTGGPVTIVRAESSPAQVAAVSEVTGGSGTEPEEGVALPPAAGPAGVEQRITQMETQSAAATSRPLPDTYLKGSFVPRPVSDAALPYHSSTVYEVSVDRDAINDRAQIVGATATQPFIWDHGRITILPFPRSDLMSQAYAWDINDHGMIAGNTRSEGVERAVIWVR